MVVMLLYFVVVCCKGGGRWEDKQWEGWCGDGSDSPFGPLVRVHCAITGYPSFPSDQLTRYSSLFENSKMRVSCEICADSRWSFRSRDLPERSGGASSPPPHRRWKNRRRASAVGVHGADNLSLSDSPHLNSKIIEPRWMSAALSSAIGSSSHLCPPSIHHLRRAASSPLRSRFILLDLRIVSWLLTIDLGWDAYVGSCRLAICFFLSWLWK